MQVMVPELALPPPSDWVRKVDWQALLEEHETPRYVYSLTEVKTRAQRVLRRFTYTPRRVLYSLKANPSPPILEELRRMGLGAETVSLNEVRQALAAGFPPESISYTACCVTRRELEQVHSLGVAVNADSPLQARILHSLGHENLGLRINPLTGAGHHEYTITGGEASKFGLLPQEATLLARELGGGFQRRVRRLHFHAGSGIWDPRVYAQALENTLPLLSVFPQVEEIDIGGGMAHDYKEGLREFDFPQLARLVKTVLEDHGLSGVRVIIEPGRTMVASAGVLVARVTDVKRRGTRVLVGVDTGMNHLIRPALYQARHRVYFPTRPPPRHEQKGTIVGNICEQGDILVPETPLPPKIEPGDPLLILDAGAYGESMASNYNSRPLKPSIHLRT